MGRTIAATLFVASTAVLLATLPTAAKEYYIGEPVVQNEMKILPHYLLGIEMAPMPKGAAMGPNAVHLEVDVHATNGEKHGFKEDEWIPYLTISYTIEKVGTKFKKAGALRAMTAKDGPHYANNVALMGDGDYRLTHSSCRQGKRGARLVAAVLREVDFPLPEQRSRLTATATRVSCTGTLRSVNVPSPS